MTSDINEIKPRGYTYAELGDMLGISPEAARQRVLRRKWKRIPSNDGTPTRVDITLDDIRPSDREPIKPKRQKREKREPRSQPNERAVYEQTIAALNAHVSGLQQELDKAQKTASDERQRVADLTAELLKVTQQLLEAQKPKGLISRLLGK